MTTSSLETPVLEAKGIAKSYGHASTQTPVLRGIDLVVRRGEIVALVGPSGCGKSTLLNVLGCLDRADEGLYLLGGRDVSKLDPVSQAWVRLHHIGFVFQSFHLIAYASALENVGLPLYYAGMARPERDERSIALLGRLGLAERAHHRPSELSGGQKQRVAIARALACRPKLLLADEPTGALDSKAGREILELLIGLRDSEQLAILLVTHDSNVAKMADRRVVMRDGRIVETEASHVEATG